MGGRKRLGLAKVTRGEGKGDNGGKKGKRLHRNTYEGQTCTMVWELTVWGDGWRRAKGEKLGQLQ